MSIDYLPLVVLLCMNIPRPSSPRRPFARIPSVLRVSPVRVRPHPFGVSASPVKGFLRDSSRPYSSPVEDEGKEGRRKHEPRCHHDFLPMGERARKARRIEEEAMVY